MIPRVMQDIQLGVIETVPIGEHVTWCLRMVVCAKKNGKPRRTVDFQALNVHATRETHRLSYKPDLSHVARREHCLMHGMATTVYVYQPVKKIAI